MTVSDESGESRESKWVFRSDAEWNRIRSRYETAQPSIPLRSLAKLENIPLSTLMKKAARDQWKKPRNILHRTRTALIQATDAAIQVAVQDAAQQSALAVVNQLQPIIEREKARHIERQILRSNGHLDRLDYFLKRKRPLAPKDEANVAKAVSSHVMDLRRTLGMGDESGLEGSLSVRVLTQGAAIEISQS